MLETQKRAPVCRSAQNPAKYTSTDQDFDDLRFRPVFFARFGFGFCPLAFSKYGHMTQKIGWMRLQVVAVRSGSDVP